MTTPYHDFDRTCQCEWCAHYRLLMAAEDQQQNNRADNFPDNLPLTSATFSEREGHYHRGSGWRGKRLWRGRDQ